jgi:hypothetical protein
MMTPYEGERIFEAEMVRLHQCDRKLYTCCAPQRQAPPATTRRSFWQWLLHGKAQPAPSNLQAHVATAGRTPD